MISNFDQIVQEVLDKVDLEREELMKKIGQKQEELGGFVTPEGAATIVARSYGIVPKREEPRVRKLRIDDISAGMSNVDIVGRVAMIRNVREFERKDGSPGSVVNLVLQDKTGKIKTVLWDERTVLVEKGEIEKGTALRITGAYVKRGFRDKLEVHIGRRGEIEIDPSGERAEELPTLPETKVKVSDLDPEFIDVDLVGRVIAVTEPRTFERADGSKGKVATLVVADETGQTRVSLWDDKADLVDEIQQGDAIKFEGAYVREGWKKTPELHLGRRGRITKPSSSEARGLPEFERKLLRIEEIESDMPLLDLAARVQATFQPREFERDDGTTGRVMNVILADETGTIRASFWGEMVKEGQKLSPDDVVLLRNVHSSKGLNDRPEIRVGKRASIEIEPKSVEVGRPKPSKIDLDELEPGLDALNVEGRVLNVSEVREFTRSDGSSGRVASLTIGNQTGTARISLWDEKADLVENVEIGDVVELANSYSTIGLYGQPEIHVGHQGDLRICPAIEEELPPIDELREGPTERVNIGEIEREGVKIVVKGTIVRVFERRPLFDVCPQCGRNLGKVGSSLLCEECGKTVNPEHRVVVSMVVDDGTGSIRAVAFGKVGEKLLGKNASKIFELFKKSSDLSKLYEEFGLAGREIILDGTTRRDRYSDQLELRINDIEAPRPEREARRLLEKVKV